MFLKNLLDGLNEEQKKAVTLQANAVVTAGAGSGKTRVLASRYAWLITEKKLKPDEILTLTFTNKAVSEMYSRIYRYLLDQVNGNSPEPDKVKERTTSANPASAALKEFHKARISTLDSFSASIVRAAAARYGISPDFKNSETDLRELAREAALRFVLDHRETSVIRTLLADHKVRTLSEEIFAKTVLNYSPISSPLNLNKTLTIQKDELLRVWQEKTRVMDNTIESIIEALHVLAETDKSIGLTKSLEEILLNKPLPSLPDLKCLFEIKDTIEQDWDILNSDSGEEPLFAEARQKIKSYFEFYNTLISIRTPGTYREIFTPVVNFFRMLKGRDGDGLYHELESIANYILNFRLCSALFHLIDKFQNEFNVKKRETGLLSFADLAQLAVDILINFPDIRKVFKDSTKMIMIDEFQDNNSLQRDLIYLLAENPNRMEKGIPRAAELEKNRIFFVGDEKQSIYRFRGADVSVFRSLGRDLSESGEGLTLNHNYRSLPALIDLYNFVFSKVFLPAEDEAGRPAPDFEASYSPIKAPGKTANDEAALYPLAHFCFFDGEELLNDETEGLKSQDLEAAFIAAKIRDMVQNKEKLLKQTGSGKEWVECNWKDFAVLERTYTHQSCLEKYFREFGIPFNTDRPSGLFNNASILDLRAYLRLLVYPEDRIAYATLIRSPFMRLSDLSLTVCMLGAAAEPFAEENESLIPEKELALYRRARERYNTLRDASRSLSVTELITKLWFEEGYRCETLWNESAQAGEVLFDLFYSLAAEIDKQGKSLADFIEYIDDVMNREEKLDDKDIPGEGEGGVRILSIHKSKGLEFPVLFLFDCTNAGNFRQSAELISFHEKYGLIFNIPQAEELPLGGNYFRKVFTEEEKKKDSAELRRLLYVAMTRAENRLFLCFTLPAQTKKEKEEWDIQNEDFTEETIRRRLAQLDEKPEGRDTFLRLLAGIMSDCPSSLCSFETIPVLSRAEIKAAARGKTGAGTGVAGSHSGITEQKKAALEAAPYYEKAELIPEGKAGPVYLQAVSLSKNLSRQDAKPPRREENSTITEQNLCVFASLCDENWEKTLEKTGVQPEDFGSLVHAVLEGRFKGQAYSIPSKIRSRLEEKTKQKVVEIAENMADVFLGSELGKRCIASLCRESEFSIVTSAAVSEKKSIAITGQIDLVFEEENEVVVVDFKTDREENPQEHYGQLAVYHRAAADIFGKKASVWLYYLRSGNAVNVTEEVENLSLEELALAAIKENDSSPLDHKSV